MTFNSLVRYIVMVIVVFGSGINLGAQEKWPAAAPINCDVPWNMVNKIRTGIQFAIDEKAAILIDDVDLMHVHFMVSKEHNEEILKRGNLTALELMEESDAMLFHSQEADVLRDNFPVEIRKLRNIFYDLRNRRLEILNTDNYSVDERYYTIFSELTLGFVETFQISFYRLPDFVDQVCSLTSFDLLPSGAMPKGARVVITQVMMSKIGSWAVRKCFCSGAIQDW